MFGQLFIVKKNNELGGFLDLDPEAATGQPFTKTFGSGAQCDIRIKKASTKDVHAQLVIEPTGKVLLETFDEATTSFAPSRNDPAQNVKGRIPILDGYIIQIDGREFLYRAPSKKAPTTPGKAAPTPGKKAAITPKRNENENPNAPKSAARSPSTSRIQHVAPIELPVVEPTAAPVSIPSASISCSCGATEAASTARLVECTRCHTKQHADCELLVANGDADHVCQSCSSKKTQTGPLGDRRKSMNPPTPAAKKASKAELKKRISLGTQLAANSAEIAPLSTTTPQSPRKNQETSAAPQSPRKQETIAAAPQSPRKQETSTAAAPLSPRQKTVEEITIAMATTTPQPQSPRKVVAKTPIQIESVVTVAPLSVAKQSKTPSTAARQQSPVRVRPHTPPRLESPARANRDFTSLFNAEVVPAGAVETTTTVVTESLIITEQPAPAAEEVVPVATLSELLPEVSEQNLKRNTTETAADAVTPTTKSPVHKKARVVQQPLTPPTASLDLTPKVVPKSAPVGSSKKNPIPFKSAQKAQASDSVIENTSTVVNTQSPISKTLSTATAAVVSLPIAEEITAVATPTRAVSIEHATTPLAQLPKSPSTPRAVEKEKTPVAVAPLASLPSLLVERSAAIDAREAALAERETALATREAQWKTTEAETQSRLIEQAAKIESLSSQLSSAHQALAERDVTIRQLQQQLAEKTQPVATATAPVVVAAAPAPVVIEDTVEPLKDEEPTVEKKGRGRAAARKSVGGAQKKSTSRKGKKADEEDLEEAQKKKQAEEEAEAAATKKKAEEEAAAAKKAEEEAAAAAAAAAAKKADEEAEAAAAAKKAEEEKKVEEDAKKKAAEEETAAPKKRGRKSVAPTKSVDEEKTAPVVVVAAVVEEDTAKPKRGRKSVAPPKAEEKAVIEPTTPAPAPARGRGKKAAVVAEPVEEEEEAVVEEEKPKRGTRATKKTTAAAPKKGKKEETAPEEVEDEDEEEEEPVVVNTRGKRQLQKKETSAPPAKRSTRSTRK